MKNHVNIKAYRIRTAFMVSVLVLFLLALIGCMLWEASQSSKYNAEVFTALQQGVGVPINQPSVIPSVLVSVLTAIISILISSMLAIVFIEKDSENQVYSQAYQDWLSDARVAILQKGSDIIYQSQKEIGAQTIPEDLTSVVIDKIYHHDSPYYYEECNYTITYRLVCGCIEKTIRKSLAIKSYNEHYTYYKKSNPFKIARYICDTKERENIAKIEHVTINKKPVRFKSSSKQNTDSTYEELAVLDDNLELSCDKPTNVMVTYKTYTSMNDTFFSLRMPCASKHTHVTASVESMDGYSIEGKAFGFFDDATPSQSDTDHSSISLEFNNWIFKRDGFCFSIKKTENESV